MAITILPSDTLMECLKERADDLGGQGINLFRNAVAKSKSDLLDHYIRPHLLSQGRSYIYLAEDKGKTGRRNFDPGNTLAATTNNGLALPGRWGLFTNPLAWVDIDTGRPGGTVSTASRGPRPSDRPINISFCVYTLEFDKLPISEQLKAIWDGGFGCTEKILTCFKDYRGCEVVYSGRNSLHFHFVFDLRHWNHDLAFASNSSYQEHWLTDFPDIYLREAHQDRWEVIECAFRRGTGIDADSDGSRPGFRDDLAHHSDLMSLGVPG